MKILKFFVPENLAANKGLKEIDLTKKPLNKIVAFAGKNGSGKSRILDFLNGYYNTCTIESILFENHFEGIHEKFPVLKEYLTLDHEISKLNSELKKTPGNNPTLLKRRQSLLQSLQEKQQKKAFNEQQKPQLIISVRNHIQSHIKYVNSDNLKKLTEKIQNKPTFKELISNPKLTNEFEILGSKSTLEYINELCTDVIEAKFNLHINESKESEIENNDSYKKFNELKQILEELLNKKFTYKHKKNDEKKIIGELIEQGEDIQTLFNYQNLSTGEKTLFAYGILFFFQSISSNSPLKESIIIIDEPELNLHPSAQVMIIDKLKDFIGETGQLWIATHSLHILSHLNHEEIILVDNNRIISPSVLTPLKTFNSLMGTEKHIHKLTQFVSSISDWTFSSFIVDCFREPDVIPWSNQKDPQVEVFKKVLGENTEINVLDYGAGKGRVGLSIMNDKELSEKIKYYSALEPEPIHYETLKKIENIVHIYIENEPLPENQFDVILLCNVLHEIHPKHWNNIFISIKKSLKENGSLIILEDKHLPKGEKANEYGFLLMTESQLKILLGYEQTEELNVCKHPNPTYADRILCTLIPKIKINTTPTLINESLKNLESETFEKIKSLRNQNDERSMRLYALFCQQYINAKLAYEGMSKHKKKM